MSVTVMAAVWARSESTGTARLVLLALADEASDRGEVTAYRRSLSHLASKCRCSTDSVRRAVGQLVDLGELAVLKRGDGRTPSDYQINVDALGAASIEGGAGATPGVAEVLPQGSRRRTPRGSTAATPITPLFPPVPGRPPGDDSVDAVAETPSRRVARTVWEQKKPRPAIKFVAVMKIAEALLDAGHEEPAVTAAMIAAPTITVAAVELQLNRRNGSGPAPTKVDTDRAAASGLVDVL